VITMEMFGKVRRMFFRDGISRSEIARTDRVVANHDKEMGEGSVRYRAKVPTGEQTRQIG
jgi:hypothetical protein